MKNTYIVYTRTCIVVIHYITSYSWSKWASQFMFINLLSKLKKKVEDKIYLELKTKSVYLKILLFKGTLPQDFVSLIFCSKHSTLVLYEPWLIR